MDEDIAAYLEAQVDKKILIGTTTTGKSEEVIIPKKTSTTEKSSRSTSDREKDRRDLRSRSREGQHHRRSGRRSSSRDGHRRRHRSRSRSYDRDRDRDGGRRRRSRSRDHDELRRRESPERDRVTTTSTAPAVIPPPKSAFESNQEKEIQRRQKEIDDLTKDQRTIFVGQLTMKVNEAQLKTFFSQLGEVKGVIMVRDKFTGKHKGFAYVEMGELDVIPNCLLLNNIVPDFQKFPILVKASEAEKNFVAKKENATGYDSSASDSRLYIGNLHVNLTESDLRGVLAQYGVVEMLSIHRDEVGVSKGFAFIKFATAESAANAMSKLAGYELMGRPVKVGFITEHGSGSSNNNNTATATSSSGASANWKLDDDDGAGLQMNAQSRAMLMNKLGQAAGLVMPTPVLPPNMGAPPIIGAPTRCFRIKNMFDPNEETEPDWDLDVKEDVTEECSKFGAVEHCYVESKKPGGLVFIRFTNVDSAKAAAASLNGRFFAGRQISLEYIDPAKYSTLLLG